MNAFFFPKLQRIEALAHYRLRTYWNTKEVLDVDVESALRSNPALHEIFSLQSFPLSMWASGALPSSGRTANLAQTMSAWGKEQKNEASHIMFYDWMRRNNLSRIKAATALGYPLAR